MSKVNSVIGHQVKDIYQYKNIKKKSLTCIANIHFNQQCLKKISSQN